jgi:predicted nucleic acid-binding protein
MAERNSLFIDTSGWMALLRADEPQHTDAVKIFDSSKQFITTNYVLAELIPLANSRGIQRSTSYRFVKEIESSELVTIVWIDIELHGQAMDLLETRLDKSYSLCDAVSFVVMREYKLTDALTTDRHFQQEGFARMLG